MTAVIGSTVFNKGAMYRNVLREGVVTKGRVTSIQRDFPGNEGRLRAHIDWSVPGRASTLTTQWEKGPFSRYSVGSEVDLIIHDGNAYFLNEARAVGGGWLLWAGWVLIVGAPGILFYFLGLFRAKLDFQSETLPRNEKHHSRRFSDESSSSVLPEPSYVSSDYSVPNQVSNPKQFQPKKNIIPAIFLIGFLVLDFLSAPRDDTARASCRDGGKSNFIIFRKSPHGGGRWPSEGSLLESIPKADTTRAEFMTGHPARVAIR